MTTILARYRSRGDTTAGSLDVQVKGTDYDDALARARARALALARARARKADGDDLLSVQTLEP